MAVDLVEDMDHPEDLVAMEQLGQEEEHQAEDHLEDQAVDPLGRPEADLLEALVDRREGLVDHQHKVHLCMCPDRTCSTSHKQLATWRRNRLLQCR